MMLFNITETKKEFKKESNEIVGRAFSLLEKIKIGGARSGTLEIEEFSANLQPEEIISSAIHFSTIELRPKGIIIYYSIDLQRYAWIIPYYRLVIYKTRTFTIHANGHFIKIRKNDVYKESKIFLEKMIDLKNDSLNLEYYDV